MVVAARCPEHKPAAACFGGVVAGGEWTESEAVGHKLSIGLTRGMYPELHGDILGLYNYMVFF